MAGKAERISAKRKIRGRLLVGALSLLAAVAVPFIAPGLWARWHGVGMPPSTVRAASPDTVVIATPLALFEHPRVTLDQGTVSLATADSGESRIGAVLRALMSGGGADLVLGGGRIVVDRTGEPVPAAASEPSDEPLRPLVAALKEFKFSNLSLIDTTIIVKTARGSETISRVNAELAVGRHGVVTAKGGLEFRGEPLSFDLSFGLPQGSADSPLRVRADVTGKLVRMSFNGRLAPGDRGQITAPNATLAFSDLRAVARWLGSYWLSGPGLGAFSAKGQLTLDERSISFENAEFALDGNAATGALTAALGGERAAIEGTLAFPTFDVTPYATRATPYALTLATDWLSSVRLPGLASPSLLREIDVDLRISATNVTRGADRLGRCAASVSLKDGKLYGEIAEMELDQGGSGEGQFTVDATGDETAYAVHADLKDIDFSGISLAPLAPRLISGGAGTVAVELSAHGSTEQQILASMSGTVAVNLDEGGQLGINLDALPAAATAATAGPPVDGWGPVGAATTPVEKLAARFFARNGTLTTDTVMATVGDRRLTVTGTVDVDKAALDLVLSLAPAPAAEGAGDAGTRKTLGAFRVKGPWSAPAISPAPPGRSARDGIPGSRPG